jgi:hypothetical protein
MPPMPTSVGEQRASMMSPPPLGFMGIDPGASGGIAVVKGLQLSTIGPLGEKTNTDIWLWIKNVADMVEYAVIEQVGGYVGTPQSGAQMFNFGKSAGLLEGFLIAAGIRCEYATPQKWQKTFSMTRSKTDTDTYWKNRLKSKAQLLFPRHTIRLSYSDAVLIAEHARRTHGA